MKRNLRNITMGFLILTVMMSTVSFGKSATKTIKITQKSKVNGTRYGNNIVGYVTKPNNWLEFKDPVSSPQSAQLTKDSVNIITMDLVSTNGRATSSDGVELMRKKYLSEGLKKENIIIRNVSINGFTGKQIELRLPDGPFIINYIDYNGNVYFISQEGTAASKAELTSIIETWRPNK